MTGIVNASLEALLKVELQDSAGQWHEVEAVVDTGFNGSLTLSSAIIGLLGLPWVGRQQGQLADGSLLVFDVHSATIRWNGSLRIVEVEAADAQPLVGMELLHGNDLFIRVKIGGAVSIALSP